MHDLSVHTAHTMNKLELENIYRDYIACLNSQDWSQLHRFVHDDVEHNGTQLGVPGYRAMLEKDFADIPDLHYDIELLIVDPPQVASRLHFHCIPRARFLDLDVNGTKISFAENVFYAYRDRKIAQVWSVIDKVAIEAQLRARAKTSKRKQRAHRTHKREAGAG